MKAKKEKTFRYIYGPVSSWRLGSSLGVDPLSEKEKICTFDCVYCQLGKTRVFADERSVFVPVHKIIEEIQSLPDVPIDYITFSGRGEPTLAKNSGQMIREVRKITDKKIAVITNASLMGRKDVREDLFLADFVLAKLDAGSQETFKRINKPLEGIEFTAVLEGIKNFKNRYAGKLALQIMFIKENEKDAGDIARIAREIDPDEVEINTPLRPCGVEPLSERALREVMNYFEGLECISVYETTRKEVKTISDEDTLIRRGKV
ncbi:MAG: radical SAM protein [Candidatus Theseobacter exili]|nr:radical SAM protein [Candidatus Theseobacter exili]